VSGGDGKVRAGSNDSTLISGPGKSNALALGGDPVSGSLVVVTTVGVVVTVSFGLSVAGVLALDVGLLASGTIGSLEAIFINKDIEYTVT